MSQVGGFPGFFFFEFSTTIPSSLLLKKKRPCLSSPPLQNSFILPLLLLPLEKEGEEDGDLHP